MVKITVFLCVRSYCNPLPKMNWPPLNRTVELKGALKVHPTLSLQSGEGGAGFSSIAQLEFDAQIPVVCLKESIHEKD